MKLEFNVRDLGVEALVELTADELTAVLAHNEAEPEPGSLHQSDARCAAALAGAFERELSGKGISEALSDAVRTYGSTVIALMAKAKAKAEGEGETDNTENNDKEDTDEGFEW